MSANDKPIFPRSSETDEEEKQRLFWETQQKLQNAERNSGSNLSETGRLCSSCGQINPMSQKFCSYCGHNLLLSIDDDISEVYGPPPMPFNPPKRESAIPVYGPPPMRFDDKTDDDIHTSVYGPPPMSFDKPFNIKENPPMPVYGPPPMNLNLKKGNWIPWIIGGVILGFTLLVIAIAVVVIIASYFSNR
jgi:hypothetical protein